MDTKLKKSSRLAKWIIFLAVFLPAVCMVGLYPRMEKLMLEKQAEYRENITNNAVNKESDTADNSGAFESSVPKVSVQQNTVNYAMEASYYLYARLLQEDRGSEVFFDVLDDHGWINDYYTVNQESYYYAEYNGEKGLRGNVNTEVISRPELENLMSVSALQNGMAELTEKYNVVAAFLLEFDAYGMLSSIDFVSAEDVVYNHNLYSKARESVQQYQDNAEWYLLQHQDLQNDVYEVVPKNFKVLFLIPQDSEFLNNFNIDLEYYVHYFNNPENIYVEIGAPLIMLVFLVFVALVALILPFIKALHTGWEKLFCIPLEIMCIVALFFVGLAYLMFEAMCYTTLTEITQSIGTIEVLGYVLKANTLYYMALFGNVLGWMVLFFLEYICIAQFRQFFCGPVFYLKNRILVIRLLRWIGRQFKRLYHYVVDVDITKGLHASILKIVLVNLIIAGLLSCLWFAGVVGVIIYSVILYFILRKQGKKLQEQYYSILHATEQMAEGELKITLKEDLGMFEPLGDELERVQEGFAKAVEEEAKSQKMKTELISNVSHDLKTPLTAIITYVDLLKQEGVSEEDREKYIHTLDMKSQRLKVLIEDLFEVSKAQSGNIQMNYMDVDVVNMMKQLRLEMEDKLADSNLTFRWNLPEEKVILNLDAQKTYRVFENLLGNALKYAMPNSRVYVDVMNGEEAVEIVFKNTSESEMNPDAEQLTERFVRGDSSRTSEGSGLGLAIVKSFVELQGGVFKIEIDGDLFKAIIMWKKQNDNRGNRELIG